MAGAGEMVGSAAAPRASMRRVVIASSSGTTFEWYDFYIFGTLAPVISKVFFAGLNETAAFIAALGLFATGFAFRPLGALLFGSMGDRLGRKGAFLVTVSLMGGATFAIGLLPTFAAIGGAAPVLLILLRILQGLALGGEYGGAAIYVAEHAPPGRRGLSTSWIQAAACFGLIAALTVVLATRTLLGEAAFAAWGWRIPFLLSAVLLAVSVWMRVRLTESPTFQRMQAEGEVAQAPLREAFGSRANIRLVVLAFLSVMCAQGAVWYTSYFYVQVFLERSLQVPGPVANAIVMGMTLASAPFYVLFGWLSDRVGRKPVMLGGMTLALVAFFPLFHALAGYANPALMAAQARTPVIVAADPATCSVQFDPVGTARFTSPCDIAKATLVAAGVPYANRALAGGSAAVIEIGATRIAAPDGRTLAPDALKRARDAVKSQVADALAAAGYPARAEPAAMNWTGIALMLGILIIGSTALYGPMAAMLVELFPARVRYTALSLPYHVGTGWVGGFLPVTSFAIVALTGNIFSGLWYAVAFTAVSVVTTLFFLPETLGRSLDA